MNGIRIPLIAAAAALAALSAAVPCKAQDGAEAYFEALADAYRKAADAIAPCVVCVEVSRSLDIGQQPGATSAPATPSDLALPKHILEKFQENRMYNQRPQGPASGVLVSPEGHILTSWYNVAGTVKSVTVTLPDGRAFPAKILGKDEDKDLCMIKIEGSGLPAALIDSSVPIRPGRFCAVVGRGVSKTSITMTTGIISASSRNRGQAFQISARVNYENAGGAVVGLDGKLMGVVGHVAHLDYMNRQGLNTGVGLASPVQRIAEILDRLKAGEEIPRFRGPFLGIRFDQAYRGKGVKIEYVYKDLPSRKAGLLPGDVIIFFNSIQIETRNDLLFAIYQCDPDQRVGFTVQRIVDGKEETADLWAVLALRPPEEELKKLDAEYNEWKKSQPGGDGAKKEE